MKQTAYSVYGYEEIFSRFNAILCHIEGPSGFPFEIHLDAGNSTEPPVFTVNLFETQSDGSDKLLYSTVIDQNTSYDNLNRDLTVLTDIMCCCMYAAEHDVSYAKARSIVTEEEQEENEELPF